MSLKTINRDGYTIRYRDYEKLERFVETYFDWLKKNNIRTLLNHVFSDDYSILSEMQDAMLIYFTVDNVNPPEEMIKSNTIIRRKKLPLEYYFDPSKVSPRIFDIAIVDQENENYIYYAYDRSRNIFVVHDFTHVLSLEIWSMVLLILESLKSVAEKKTTYRMEDLYFRGVIADLISKYPVVVHEIPLKIERASCSKGTYISITDGELLIECVANMVPIDNIYISDEGLKIAKLREKLYMDATVKLRYELPGGKRKYMVGRGLLRYGDSLLHHPNIKYIDEMNEVCLGNYAHKIDKINIDDDICKQAISICSSVKSILSIPNVASAYNNDLIGLIKSKKLKIERKDAVKSFE